MKRLLFILASLIIWIIFLAPFTIICASGEIEKPEKVYSVIYVQKPNDWYIKQAALWREEIDKNPKDPEAWYNYYNAVRYARFVETIKTQEKKEKLQDIVRQMGEAIPETFEYYYLKYKTHHDIRNIEDLEKAYALAPERHETYSDFVGYYEIHNNREKMSEFLLKWYDSQDIASSLLNYNYNVLMSTDENPILFTNGDNDTYPIWMLQIVKGVRQDVTVLNASLMMADEKYLIRKLGEKKIKIDFNKLPAYRTNDFLPALVKYIGQDYPQVPVYLAATLWKNYIEPLKENLYLTGLAYKFSPERIDNIALIKRNLEHHFRMDYLIYDWYEERFLATALMPNLNMNYTPAIIILCEHYKLSGMNDKSSEWKDMTMKIAEKGGMKERVLQDLKSKGL